MHEESVKNKGGRIPEKSSKYYSKSSFRESNVRLAKKEFGSMAVDVIDCCFERIAQSDLFLFKLTPLNLKKIFLEDEIVSEDFMRVVSYCIDELEMFDKVLFDAGYLFSIGFVRNFERAGLFRHRTNGVKEILNLANYYRPGYPPLTLEDDVDIIAKGGKLPVEPNVIPSPIKKDNNYLIVDAKSLDEKNSNCPPDLDPDKDELPF
jgi:hypothetical protein